MKKSYGGVVINQDGQVLLREPTLHYDDYVWTFPKGEPKFGESTLETALREVLEETGIVAKSVARVPGVFRGSTSRNIYFLMAPVRDTGAFDEKETQSIRWVPQNQAAGLIPMTTNRAGRTRDLKVLKAAFDLFRKSISVS